MVGKNKQTKYGELTDLILEIIAENLLSFDRIIKPSLPILLGSLIKLILERKKANINSSKIKRILRNLEKREIISIEKKDDEVTVSLNENGEPKILKYSIKALLDFKKKEKKWQGKWFMVIFDVPEDQKNKRDYLRSFLLQLGFYPYQKSVYLFPYECEQEINLIKKIVEGGKYMKYIIAEKIEDEDQAKIHFHI